MALMEIEAPRRSGVVRRVRNRVPVLLGVSWVVLGIAAVCAVAGRWLTPQDPRAQDPLLGVTAPSLDHWLGTDELGRDILSRLIAGTQNALVGPAVVAVGAVALGLLFGMIAAYHGGWIDSTISRIADLIYALPALLIAIVVVGLISGSYLVTIAVLIFLTFPGDVRICRSVAMVESRLPYVDAAVTLGVSTPRIMLRHILPNILPTVVATVLLEFGGALVAFSALAFLGLGVAPGGYDWGTTLADGQQLLFINPMMSLAPAIILVLVTASATLVGDWCFERFSSKGVR